MFNILTDNQVPIIQMPVTSLLVYWLSTMVVLVYHLFLTVLSLLDKVLILQVLLLIYFGIPLTLDQVFVTPLPNILLMLSVISMLLLIFIFLINFSLLLLPVLLHFLSALLLQSPILMFNILMDNQLLITLMLVTFLLVF